MEAQGTISIRAFTSRAQIPIPGAAAAVTRPAGQGRHQLVALRITDENGLTEPVPLPAGGAEGWEKKERKEAIDGA